MKPGNDMLIPLGVLSLGAIFSGMVWAMGRSSATTQRWRDSSRCRSTEVTSPRRQRDTGASDAMRRPGAS